ncbi:MAG: TonB-dependent receptor [Pasteurellaceae bacterium]|nr:TonB-dependent receptor [Pasteurellaceae bacterium]
MVKKPLFKLSVVALSLVSAHQASAESTEQLAPIVITGNAVPTIITDKQLDQRVATDLKQAMKNQVGLTSSGGNGVAQFYSIRGIGEDKITLDVDGATNTSSILHHQGKFMLDPTLVKVIDIEKGAGSASAGIGALGGVIRITTLDAKDLLRENQSIGLKIGATASSNRGYGTNIATYANQNGFDALFAGHFLRNGDYKDGNDNKQYGSKLNQDSYLAKLGYDFNENHKIRFSIRQEYQEGTRKPQLEFPYSDPLEAVYGEDRSAQRQRTLNAQYEGHNIGFISKVDANVFRTQIDDYKPPKARLSDSPDMEITKTFSTGGNLNLSSEVGKHNIKYGVNYRTEKAEPSYKPWNAIRSNKVTHVGQEKKDEYGLYVEGIWDLSPVTLTTGLRYDHFKFRDNQGGEASYGKFNPSINAIWGITPNFALVATYNQASRAPRLNEALRINEAFAGVHVDKNLKPETARRGEIGFRWEQNGFKVSANVFKQTIDDLIIYGTNKTYNDGKIKLHGYEADASYVYNGFKARIAVSQSKPNIYSNSFSSNQEENPYYFWNVGRQWLTSLSYRFENPSLEIGWNARYFERVDYVGTKRQRIRDQSVGHKFVKVLAKDSKPGYGVHDIFVNWQPLHNDQLNINFGINNLFNKAYRSQSQRGNAGFYERGREFVAGFNYKF